jgi:hypothetical protein
VPSEPAFKEDVMFLHIRVDRLTIRPLSHGLTFGEGRFICTCKDAQTGEDVAASDIDTLKALTSLLNKDGEVVIELPGSEG